MNVDFLRDHKRDLQSYDALMSACLDNGEPIAFHGVGFIQVPLSPSVRMHVYHPDLPGWVDNSRIHDHKFHLTSVILQGALWQFRYEAIRAIDPGNPPDGWTVCQEFTTDPNAPPEDRCGGLVSKGKFYYLSARDIMMFSIGSCYHLPARQLHDVAAAGITATLVKRVRDTSNVGPSVMVELSASGDNRHTVPQHAFDPAKSPSTAEMADAIKDVFKQARGPLVPACFT